MAAGLLRRLEDGALADRGKEVSQIDFPDLFEETLDMLALGALAAKFDQVFVFFFPFNDAGKTADSRINGHPGEGLLFSLLFFH